jgi:hypothetical protein
VQLPSSLKSFRFALGTDDRPASGIWRLWVQEDDVHLQVQASQQLVEFTAYRTGRWRIAAGDAISRWTRPKEFRPGWIRGPDLIVPASPAPLHVPQVITKVPEPVTWYPAPKAGNVARFTLLFAGPRATAGNWTPTDVAGTERITLLSLRTAGVIHLCRRDEADDDPVDTAPGAASLQLAVRISANQAGVPSLRETYGYL